MAAALLPILAALAVTPVGGAVDARIAQAAVAAQKLQGPLDGTWTLTDRRGRALYGLQIVDPANGAAPLQAAWRAPGPNGEVGAASQIARGGGRLMIRFEDHGADVRLELRRAAGFWRGRLNVAGRDVAVVLSPG